MVFFWTELGFHTSADTEKPRLVSQLLTENDEFSKEKEVKDDAVIQF